MEMNLVSLPNARMECASLFFSFFLSFFNFRIVQLAMAVLELGRDNKSVFEQENELSFFVLVRPLWVDNGGVTAWPNQSRDRPWLLALLENNKEKKARIFSGVKKRVDIFSRSYVKRRCKLITRTNSSGQTCWPLKILPHWVEIGYQIWRSSLYPCSSHV